MKLIIFLFAFFISFISSALTEKYYRAIYETVFAEFVGVYPISDDQASKVNHYVFEYNEENQLVAIEYFSKYEQLSLYSDVLVSNRLEFQYEENSKQIFSFSLDWNGELVMSEEFLDIIYENKLVKEVSYKFMDGEDQVISSILYYNYSPKGKLYSLTAMGDSPYYFDFSGNLHAIVQLNVNNQVIEDETYTYLGDTSVLQCTHQ